MMTINMTFVQLMVIEPPTAESVMSIYGFQTPFLLEPRTWLHGTISRISPVLTTFPEHISSNPVPYPYFYTSLFSVFSTLLLYECYSNCCSDLTSTFYFYLSNHFSLLVKEQARRLKLVDVPRHPWIIHHLAAAAARQASASASQGGGSSTALNGVKKWRKRV